MAIETAVRISALLSLVFAIALLAASSVFVTSIFEASEKSDDVRKKLVPNVPCGRSSAGPDPSVQCLCDEITLHPILLKFTILNAFALVCAIGQILVSTVCGFKIYRQNCRKLGTFWMFWTMLTCTILSIIFFLTFTFSAPKCVQILFDRKWFAFAMLVAVNMAVLLAFIIIVFYNLYHDEFHNHPYPHPPLDLDDDSLLIDRLANARTGHRILPNSNLYQ